MNVLATKRENLVPCSTELTCKSINVCDNIVSFVMERAQYIQSKHWTTVDLRLCRFQVAGFLMNFLV